MCHTGKIAHISLSHLLQWWVLVGQRSISNWTDCRSYEYASSQDEQCDCVTLGIRGSSPGSRAPRKWQEIQDTKKRCDSQRSALWKCHLKHASAMDNNMISKCMLGQRVKYSYKIQTKCLIPFFKSLIFFFGRKLKGKFNYFFAINY